MDSHKDDSENQKKDLLEDTLSSMLKVSKAITAAFQMHEKGGECYKLMEQILNQYRNLKYSLIFSKTKSTYRACLYDLKEEGFLVDMDLEKDEYTPADVYDAIDLSDSLTFASNALERWLSSSSMPYEYLVVNILDRLIKIMETKQGEKGREQAKLLKIVFFDPDTAELKYDELCDLMDLKKSTFYNLKQDAIKSMSVLFFSPLAIRHQGSPFYQGL